MVTSERITSCVC